MLKTISPQEKLLKCDYCGKLYSEKDFFTSIALYGVFFLHERDEGYFGYTCPNYSCKKTILKELGIEDIRKIKRGLYMTLCMQIQKTIPG